MRIQRILPFVFSCWLALTAGAADNTLVFRGGVGPGTGKHIVFVAGDEEYRSEEGLPMLAKIMATRYGFKCTVLFSVADDSTISPESGGSLTGSEALDSADAIVMLLRFRHWPDEAMARFEKAFLAGKPIIALRTSTHAFNFPKDSKWAKYSYDHKGETWPGGFGKEVLGETWVAHHGQHKKEATHGVISAEASLSPIMNGVADLFGDTDVYTASPPPDAHILVRGLVLKGMKPTDEPVEGPKNSPMQPVAWVREYNNSAGKTNKIFCTTMGAATDLQNEGLRRMIINATYWGLGMPVPEKADVTYVDGYKPSFYGFKGHRKGLTVADLGLGKDLPEPPPITPEPPKEKKEKKEKK